MHNSTTFSNIEEYILSREVLIFHWNILAVVLKRKTGKFAVISFGRILSFGSKDFVRTDEEMYAFMEETGNDAAGQNMHESLQ